MFRKILTVIALVTAIVSVPTISTSNELNSYLSNSGVDYSPEWTCSMSLLGSNNIFSISKSTVNSNPKLDDFIKKVDSSKEINPLCGSPTFQLPSGGYRGVVNIKLFTGRSDGKRTYKKYVLERDYAGHQGSYWKLKMKQNDNEWYSLSREGSAINFAVKGKYRINLN